MKFVFVGYLKVIIPVVQVGVMLKCIGAAFM